MYYLAIEKGFNPDINGHDQHPELGDIFEYFSRRELINSILSRHCMNVLGIDIGCTSIKYGACQPG